MSDDCLVKQQINYRPEGKRDTERGPEDDGKNKMEQPYGEGRRSIFD